MTIYSVIKITPSSEEFWAKMGIGFKNHDNNAHLDWAGHHRSRIGKQGRDAEGGNESASIEGDEGIDQTRQQDKEVNDWINDYLDGPKFSRAQSREDLGEGYEDITYTSEQLVSLYLY